MAVKVSRKYPAVLSCEQGIFSLGICLGLALGDEEFVPWQVGPTL